MIDTSKLKNLNLEDSPYDEIRRLRNIILQYEQAIDVRVMSVEIMERTDRPGLLIYVTAPTATSEPDICAAISMTIMRSLQVKGVVIEQDRDFGEDGFVDGFVSSGVRSDKEVN